MPILPEFGATASGSLAGSAPEIDMAVSDVTAPGAQSQAPAFVTRTKKQQQTLEELIGGDQGNNAFYQKIIMDELNLQNQQLQQEFDIINKRKKIKKSMLYQNRQAAGSAGSAGHTVGESFNETAPYMNQTSM